MPATAFEQPPDPGKQVPSSADWIHEIKHDGYRLIVQREGKRVRLFSRNGYDWTKRYPLIVEAALRNRISSFVVDGEAVLLGIDGISHFNGLHSRKFDDEVQLYVFDVLSLENLVSKHRERLPRRQVAELDQGQEPQAAGDQPRREVVPMKTIWIYIYTRYHVGHPDHVKAFTDPEAADRWFIA